jgi:hypothetical protein
MEGWPLERVEVYCAARGWQLEKIVVDALEPMGQSPRRISVNPMELPTMFPVLVTVNNAEDLKKVYELLGDSGTQTAAAAPTAAATPAPTKKKAAAATPAPTPTPAPATATPQLSPAGQAFLINQLQNPVMELCMKDEPKMKAILAEYGVERASLVPEAKFPELLAKVNDALDPGAAERKRLESIDKSRSLI